MSDRRVRELVRELLIDLDPAELVAHVAHEAGLIPPLLGVCEDPIRVEILAWRDKASAVWFKVWHELGRKHGKKLETRRLP